MFYVHDEIKKCEENINAIAALIVYHDDKFHFSTISMYTELMKKLLGLLLELNRIEPNGDFSRDTDDRQLSDIVCLAVALNKMVESVL